MKTEDFSKIINWDNLFKQSNAFKTNKPFSFTFVENFFTDEFYKNLYDTYPKIDDSWNVASTMSKFQYHKTWNNIDILKESEPGDDPTLSEYWNKLKRYSESQEFISYFKEFSGVPVTKMRQISFVAYKKGGFQLPHIHNVSRNILIIMLYFSKNWEKGTPGGTYMASEEDESKIIFEPYNLDNSLAVFQDGPHSAHGVRYITKDVIRQGFQIYLQG